MKKIDVLKYIKPNLDNARKRSHKDISYLQFNFNNQNRKIGQNKTYKIVTYGCQANEADSETISGILNLMGFQESPSFESDMIIINSCAIREGAENRAYGELGRLKQYKIKNPNLIIIFAGCMPQEEVTVEKVSNTYQHVDIVIGTHNIYKLPEYIEEIIKQRQKIVEVYSSEGNVVDNLPKKRSLKHKAWVSIMYGCDEFCTYCIVPYTRGQERSRKKADIFNEVQNLLKEGYQEITLLGQNVNAYGKDFKDDKYLFADLLSDLAQTKIKRIRFTTSHPHDLDLKTMDTIAKYDNIMPHFHLPVQSGSDRILQKMNRHYTKEKYLAVIKELKSRVQGISITTDIIVGFPGETLEDFNETLKLVDDISFEGAFTFIYSKRFGTPAARFIDLTLEEEKKRRLLELNKKINYLSKKGNERFLGEVVEVLVDGVSKNNEEVLSGYTIHNKLVNFRGSKELIGQLVLVKITAVKTWFLIGKIAGE